MKIQADHPSWSSPAFHQRSASHWGWTPSSHWAPSCCQGWSPSCCRGWAPSCCRGWSPSGREHRWGSRQRARSRREKTESPPAKEQIKVGKILWPQFLSNTDVDTLVKPGAKILVAWLMVVGKPQFSLHSCFSGLCKWGRVNKQPLQTYNRSEWMQPVAWLRQICRFLQLWFATDPDPCSDQ